ncbi:MAG TPA: hypothetical protein VGG33_16970, partial [Polyangia bacterium]
RPEGGWTGGGGPCYETAVLRRLSTAVLATVVMFISTTAIDELRVATGCPGLSADAHPPLVGREPTRSTVRNGASADGRLLVGPRSLTLPVATVADAWATSRPLCEIDERRARDPGHAPTSDRPGERSARGPPAA